MNAFNKKICPNCGLPIYGHPAISRKDNKTEICSHCGTAEALAHFEHYLITKNEGLN